MQRSFTPAYNVKIHDQIKEDEFRKHTKSEQFLNKSASLD